MNTCYDKSVNPLLGAEEIEKISLVFESGSPRLSLIRSLASDMFRLIHDLDPFIQKNTADVCPGCTKVCCANRHSYHELFDAIYLFALGKMPPEVPEGLCGHDPCRLLGEKGCTIDRALRPYRCNWYYCSPLLEHIREVPAKEYRGFIHLNEKLSAARDAMLDEFFSAAKATGVGF